MPTATLKSPRTLRKYGKLWVKDVETTIDFKEYKKMEGDPRFTFGGIKITVEEDTDATAPATEEGPDKKPSKGRTRTKVSDVVPDNTAAPKKGGVKIVKKGAASAPALEPEKPTGDQTPPTGEEGNTGKGDAKEEKAD